MNTDYESVLQLARELSEGRVTEDPRAAEIRARARIEIRRQLLMERLAERIAARVADRPRQAYEHASAPSYLEQEHYQHRADQVMEWERRTWKCYPEESEKSAPNANGARHRQGSLAEPANPFQGHIRQSFEDGWQD